MLVGLGTLLMFTGTALINVIADCLWYLDGHHETLAGQSCSVPAELTYIQGYNKPESHGHKRKSSSSRE